MTPPRITPAAILPSHRHTPDWIDVNITSNNLRDKPTLFAYTTTNKTDMGRRAMADNNTVRKKVYEQAALRGGANFLLGRI